MRSIKTLSLLLLALGSLACITFSSFSGSAVTLTFARVDSANADADSLEQARAIVQQRLDESLTSTATVTVADGQLVVELWNADDSARATQLATEVGALIFFDSDEAFADGDSVPDNVIPVLTDVDIAEAQAEESQFDGQWRINITLTEDGKGKLAGYTQANVGRYLVIARDGVIISSPLVNSAITGGEAQIAGDFDESAAKAFAAQLNSGRLPFELELLETE